MLFEDILHIKKYVVYQRLQPYALGIIVYLE